MEEIQTDESLDQAEVILGKNNVVLPKQERCSSHQCSIVGGKDFEKKLPPQVKKSLNFLLRKLRRVWSLVIKSCLAKKNCSRICKRMVAIPNATRWNSKYDACKVVFSLKDTVIDRE